jgi:predicted enzyme related to lactoylglutathione lyase
MPNAINWFEIPATNFDRAKKFYETVLATALMPMEAPGRKMAAFPADWKKGELGGALVAGEGATPSATGVTLFLNCGNDLAPALARVEKAGGQVAMPKTKIPMSEAGHMAFIVDTEGNRIGLHSPN